MRKSLLILLFLSFFTYNYAANSDGNSDIVCHLSSPIIKQATKRSVKKVIKENAKNAAKNAAKGAIKNSSKGVARKLATKEIGSEVLKKMTKEQQELFLKKGYRQVSVNINGVKKNLLVSKDFDPNLKIPREYTGDWDPVKVHNGDPRYVVDGCETNLGRMKRGLAPLFKDPSNTKPKWHGYSEFELHHGGQKADPDYFALMGKEHETESRILHTNPKGKKSEIDRASFNRKERAPMYKEWASQLANELFPQAQIK